MLKLVQTNWGMFDLAFDENAVFDAETAFSTLVYAALFTDAEADELQAPDRYERRGWWYDPTLGSLIWWLRQNPLSKQIRAATIENITNVLSAYPALSNVVVEDITPPRSVSLLIVTISALYNGVNVILKLEPLAVTSGKFWAANQYDLLLH
ncbi:hypothetical protein EPO05_06675, partial [Patescibacteria group bacterium]